MFLFSVLRETIKKCVHFFNNRMQPHAPLFIYFGKENENYKEQN